MYITELEAVAFRNLSGVSIRPCKEVNLIYGDNAQGKTNLLEALWMFTGCRSFRAAKDAELLQFGKQKARLFLEYYGQDRLQTMQLDIEKGRTFTQNGVRLPSPARAMGEFLAVVFSPLHLTLVKDGPAARRRFLDNAIGQLKPKYGAALSDYNKALMQRNLVLKDAAYHRELFDTLDVWEDRIAYYGSEILRQRIGYVQRLRNFSADIYAGISQKKETLRISYAEAVPTEGSSRKELYESLLSHLKQARKDDLLTGTTSVGPHRDDLAVEIDFLSARTFASQGQQRSAALALKLGEAAVIRNFTNEQPVALLDDVMSELDAARQNYILNHIRDWQVFITCCDPSSVKSLRYGKAFAMKEGRILK